MLNSLTPTDQLTLRMFDDKRWQRFRQVSVVVDEINKKYGRDTIRFAVANLDWGWKTRFQKKPPRYTTCLQEALRIT